jgi:hypothetical protein
MGSTSPHSSFPSQCELSTGTRSALQASGSASPVRISGAWTCVPSSLTVTPSIRVSVVAPGSAHAAARKADATNNALRRATLRSALCALRSALCALLGFHGSTLPLANFGHDQPRILDPMGSRNSILVGPSPMGKSSMSVSGITARPGPQKPNRRAPNRVRGDLMGDPLRPSHHWLHCNADVKRRPRPPLPVRAAGRSPLAHRPW